MLTWTLSPWFTATPADRAMQVGVRGVTGLVCGYSRKRPYHDPNCRNYNPQRSKK